MKKFLSLVLALVMTMSLVTISAGAKDFTDKSSVKYNEAVDVMSGIGIIDGYTDGSFNPNGTLTRGAAAKIISCMVLGKTAAESLGVASAPFSDVPTTNVFSGYIAYCAENGYINGYADGTFKPAGTLTGYAFLKMLECALGYDSAIEEFTGTNWTVKVATIAIKKGLTKGNDSFVGTKAATREEACLYAFNTLKAKTVYYSNKGTNITVNGTTINTGASDAADNLNGTSLDQFYEQYQSNLKLSTPNDSLGRPANTWMWKATKIGTYPQKAAVTFTASTKETAVRSALSSYSFPSAGIVSVLNDVTSTTIHSYADVDDLTGNGTVVELYADSDNAITNVVVITPKLAQIIAINTTSEYVSVSGYGKVYKSDDAALYAQLAAMSVDDYIVVSYQDLGTDAIVEAYKPTTVAGTASALNGAKVTLGGTVYTATATFGSTALGNAITSLGDTDYTLYLDQYGYVVGAEETSASSSTYAYAIDYSRDGSAMAGYTYNVKLVMSDGSTKWVAMSQYAGTAMTKSSARTAMSAANLDDVGTTPLIVSYSALTDGTYNMTVASYTATGVTLTKNSTYVNGTVTANNSTVFLYKNGDDTYTAYTGIKNLPAKTTSSASIVMNTNSAAAAKLIVVTSGTKSAGSADVMYIISTAGTAKVNGSMYYTYNALVNGTEKTVYCADTSSYAAGSFYSGAAYSDAEYNVLTAYGAAAGSLISAEVIGAGTTPNYYSYDSSVNTLTLKSDLLTVDSATFSVSDDFKVYFVDTSLTPDAVADLALTSTTITASGAKVLVSVDGTANGLATAVYVIGAIS